METSYSLRTVLHFTQPISEWRLAIILELAYNSQPLSDWNLTILLELSYISLRSYWVISFFTHLLRTYSNLTLYTGLSVNSTYSDLTPVFLYLQDFLSNQLLYTLAQNLFQSYLIHRIVCEVWTQLTQILLQSILFYRTFWVINLLGSHSNRFLFHLLINLL